MLDNCVGFANGRFNESINDPNLKGIVKAFKYQLVCDAEDFIESAKRQGLKISKTPIEGGVMVWQKGSTLSPHDGAGHVAFVEAVYDDGTILTSESGWLSWAFKLVRRDNKNGRWGQNSAYKFRGCIINPSIANPKVVPVPPLTVDGIGGPDTVRALQRFVGTPEDGEISGQTKGLAKWHPALKAVTYGSAGSVCVKAVQKWLGITADGQWGKGTSKALQRVIGVDDDGIFGPASMKALQKYLNAHDKADPSAGVPTLNKGKVIDVSEFQENIDWNKVKESGIVGAIIRCGYRGAEKGTLNTDAHFFEHIKGAHAAGLKVGIYMFTEGINAAEGAAEADYAVQLAQKAGIPLSYPIAVDTETVYYLKSGKKCDGRANKLSKAKRTEVIKAFCERIKALGFEPMIYASTSWLNNKLDMTQLPYKVWVAQYNTVCEYKGEYVMWQYTSQGSVPGINGNVDMNECYLKDTEPVDPKPYGGEYPDTKVSRGPEVAARAKEYAWPEGTSSSKSDYEDGAPKDSYKAALKKFMDKTARISLSDCGYFVSTVVRSLGISSTFLALPGEYKDKYPAVPSWLSIVHKGAIGSFKLEPGDVVRYRKKGGQHVVIYLGGGLIAHAGRGHWFPKVVKSAPWNNDNVKQSTIQVIRANSRNYLKRGDEGEEIEKLQKYINWFFYPKYGKDVLTVDGKYGPATEGYCKLMQFDLGFKDADGLVGPKTVEAMKAYKK